MDSENDLDLEVVTVPVVALSKSQEAPILQRMEVTAQTPIPL